jgi:anthranilate synthase component I
MFRFEPSRDEFARLAQSANTIPVYCSLLSDRLTPVSAFERLASGSEHAFLLESVVGGEKIARYSFLGTSPIALIESSGSKTSVTEPADSARATPAHLSGKTQSLEGVDPLVPLEDLLAGFRSAHPATLPRFLGGAVGFAGYDIIRHYEKLGTPPPDDRQLPDLLFGLYDQMVIFDHVRKLINVVAHGHVAPGDDPGVAYDEAVQRIQGMIARLGGSDDEPLKPLAPPPVHPIAFESSVTREQFEQAVMRCKEYIRAGDIFQVVISQRLSSTTSAAPFDVYRALRVINPSPFMFYMQSPKVTLVGASPEILCRIEGRTITSRPLAGTRPRGKTEAEDRGLEAELLADPKERAEHIMLVDLGRNDLGRVCEPGSVKVDDLMSIERYSHVMHICSNVVGTLANDKTPFDAVRSVIPVGTVSGAPKVRAMQIIDELETVRRGPYAGAVGYIDFAGNMDTCIALRTLVITPDNEKPGQWRVDAQVGAGIVADSEPGREYQETLNKAQSMLGALHLANTWAREQS